MTAIAGGAGAATSSAETYCNALLEGQRAYAASAPFFQSLGGATFASALFPTLPEDKFDQGPLIAGGRFLVAADIRIDNRPELIAQLGIDSVQARSRCDADLLSEAWLRWEEGCLDHLVGDFAFAVWDSERRKLTLARDPTGQRPLFFAPMRDAVAFSSTPAGLLNCPALHLRFAYPRLAATMVGVAQLETESLFEGMYRVLPGHVATWRGAAVIQQPFWSPPQEELRLSADEYVEAYRHHLDQAVAARLRHGSGSIGAHLSAGYDSSAVAATSARLSQDEAVTAFTCAPRSGFDGPVPPGRLADESAIAALAARRNDMKHVIVRPSRGALADLRRHARVYQDPAVNLANMEWWTEILRRASQSGISTMLVAVMGNLSINARGLTVLPQWIRQGSLRAWFAEARAAAARPDVRWRGVLFNSFAEWLPSALVGRLESSFRGIPSARDQSFFREEWQSRLPRDPLPQLQSGARYPDRLNAIRAMDVGLFRKGALGDCGIDERDAMADRRLIDFGFRLPPEQLLHRGEYHPLARRALADRLPSELLDLNLRGLQGADWFERVNKAQARDITEELAACHAAAELLDIDRLRSAIERWPEQGTADPNATVIYRMRLPMALATGAFIQEFAGEVLA